MVTEDGASFGQLLQRHRVAEGLTQEELAERARLSARAISDLERGVKTRPHLATVRQLADALRLRDEERSRFQLAARGHDASHGHAERPDLRASSVRTFLFADLRGYTEFTVAHGDEAAARLVRRFGQVVVETVSSWDGTVIEHRGDEALAVFASARQTLRAAVELQQRLAEESNDSLPLRAGVGLDAGEAVPVEGGFRGTALNLAARLCSRAAAGEVLASEGVIHLARKVEGLEYTARTTIQLKGFADPVNIVQVLVAPEDFPLLPEGRGAPHRGEEREGEQRLPIGGFLGALPSGPLIAREKELITALGAVEVVGLKQGRLLFIAGEAGIGKTRLAQEITRVVHGRKFLVAAGRCYEPQRSIPYYPFLEVLRVAYATAPAAIRTQAGRRWPYLSRLLPDQLGSAAGAPSSGPEEQELLFRAVTGFVQALAEVSPIAILLDDLHCADSASLQLLHHLARQTRSSAVLLLGTYRDVEVDPQHPLEATLLELSREQLLERVILRRLAERDTAAFITETVGAVEAQSEFAALVHRHTDGNPFFTQQVLQMLIENGSVYRRDGQWKRREIQEIEVPESVRSVIAQRISRLDRPAQEILQEASVLGPAFSFDDLLAMKQSEENLAALEDAVDVALTEASTLGLVRMTGRDRYAFDHALTQQALYAALSPRRRRRLHLAVGSALEKLPERRRQQRAAELAWHFLQGDDAEKAIAYALLAGDRAEEVFAHQEAEQHYRTALELIQETEGKEQLEAEALEKLGAVLKVTSRYDEAKSLLVRAARIYHTSDLEAEARAMAQIGAIDGLTGAPEGGIKRLEPFVVTLEQRPPSPGLAMLYNVLVRLYNVTGRQQEQFKASERLVQLARGLQDERLLAEAEVHRGVSLIHTGRYEEAIPVLEAAIEGAERIGDLHTLCTAIDFAAYCYYSRRDLDRTMRYRERLVEVAEQLGDPFEISYRTVQASYYTFLTGDWRRAREFAERGLTAILDSNNLRAFLQPLYNLGELSLHEGKWEEAASYARECITIAQHLGRVDALRDAHALLAEMALLHEDVDGALEHVQPFVGTPGWDEQVIFLLILGSAYLASGNMDGAEDAAAKVVAEVTRQRLTTGLVDALRLQGTVAAQRGAWDEAEAHFQRAMQLAHEITYPWGEAQALYYGGLMWTQRGELDRARAQLGAAVSLFARLGAEPHRARADAALNAVGRLQTR